LICRALVVIALLTAAPAVSAQSKKLKLTVTDTLLTEYRADNQNQRDDDDYYGVVLNRLNLMASAEDVIASQRLDLLQFIEAPTDDYQSEITLERINLRYRLDDWTIMLGDFYRQLGRGIALSVRKVDEMGLDVTLRGGQVSWSGEHGDMAVFGGVTNSVNIDAVSQKYVEDPYDIFAGALGNVWVTEDVKLGLYGLYMQPDEPILTGRDFSATGGGSVELQMMDGDAALYVEGVGQYRELAGIDDVGYAGYLALDLAIDDFTMLAEGIFMSKFEQRGSTNTAIGSRFNYSNAPTLERQDQEVINNRDVAGGRLRLEGTLLDGDLMLHGNVLYRATDQLSDTAIVHQIHGYVGGEYSYDDGDSKIEASAGYRHEIQGVSNTELKTMIHFDANYIQKLTEAVALSVTSVNELRTFVGEPYQRGSLFVGVDWVDIGGLTAEFGYDNQNTMPGANHYFIAGIGVVHINDNAQIRATVGTQRGGLKCIAGICRQFPEFAGGRIEAVARF
jgi:hypothetical protein